MAPPPEHDLTTIDEETGGEDSSHSPSFGETRDLHETSIAVREHQDMSSMQSTNDEDRSCTHTNDADNNVESEDQFYAAPPSPPPPSSTPPAHQPPTFPTLPSPILLTIFKSLDQATSVCLGLSCKRFYKIHRSLHGPVMLWTTVWFDCKPKIGMDLESLLCEWLDRGLMIKGIECERKATYEWDMEIEKLAERMEVEEQKQGGNVKKGKNVGKGRPRGFMKRFSRFGGSTKV